MMTSAFVHPVAAASAAKPGAQLLRGDEAHRIALLERAQPCGLDSARRRGSCRVPSCRSCARSPGRAVGKVRGDVGDRPAAALPDVQLRASRTRPAATCGRRSPASAQRRVGARAPARRRESSARRGVGGRRKRAVRSETRMFSRAAGRRSAQIGVEQCGIRLAVHYQRQLPGQVVRILDAAVAAAPAEGTHDVRGVAREQHAAISETPPDIRCGRSTRRPRRSGSSTSSAELPAAAARESLPRSRRRSRSQSGSS